MSFPVITREQAVPYRLRVNHLAERLPAGSYEEAAYAGLQDTAPRDALLGLHARVARCEPTSWAHPSLIQTYSPREAVYVLPQKDFGVFTVGRLPLAAEAVQRIDELADSVCRKLDGRELRGGLPGLRSACASGRIALRWTTSALWVREVPRPEVDVGEARKEHCRRHVHRFAPTSPKTFAWWAGMSPADGRKIWDRGGLFIAPGKRTLTPAADSFHPNGRLVDGRIAGAWGRKGGRVDVVLTERLTPDQYDELAGEISALPLHGAHLSLHKSR